MNNKTINSGDVTTFSTSRFLPAQLQLENLFIAVFAVFDSESFSH